MKYKIVKVYTGYAENSITSIDERESNCNLREMHEQVLNELRSKEYYDPEFYGTSFSDKQAIIQATKNVATHDNGEEDILIIVPETNKDWFNELEDIQAGGPSTDEWVEFISSLNF